MPVSELPPIVGRVKVNLHMLNTCMQLDCSVDRLRSERPKEKRPLGSVRERRTENKKQIEMKKEKYKTGAWIGLLLDYCIRSTTWLGLIILLKERTTSSFRSRTKLECFKSLSIRNERFSFGWSEIYLTFLPVVRMEGNSLFSALDKRMPPCLRK